MVDGVKITKKEIRIEDIINEVRKEIRLKACTEIFREEMKELEDLEKVIKTDLKNAYENEIKEEVYNIAKEVLTERRRELGETKQTNNPVAILVRHMDESIDSKLAAMRGATKEISNEEKEEYEKRLNERWEFIERCKSFATIYLDILSMFCIMKVWKQQNIRSLKFGNEP